MAVVLEPECLLLSLYPEAVCLSGEPELSREEEAGSLNVVAVSCTMYVR